MIYQGSGYSYANAATRFLQVSENYAGLLMWGIIENSKKNCDEWPMSS
jgi:hypothetical protein